MSKKYLTIIFSVTSLVVILLTNSILNGYYGYKNMNPFSNNTSKSIRLSSETEKNITDILGKYSNTALYIEDISLDVCYGQAIYYNNFKFNIPMINGRFLSEGDFNKDSLNYIVIGKNLEKYISKINDKNIIKINDIEYEVIGIMGYEDTVSILDSRFFINLNGYLKNTPINTNLRFNLTTSSDSYNSLLNEINENFNDLTIENSNSNILSTIAINSKSLIILTSIMVILFLLNIINITSYYVKDKLKEIGIRKNYGARSVNIFKNILRDYFIIITAASIIATIFYLIIIKSKLSVLLFGSTIYLIPILITYIITILIGFLISFIALRKANKYPINILIKGV